MPPPGRRRNASPLILFFLIVIYISTASAASAVLGIDLGTEYIKAALVKPGIPLEIILTKDSKRKEAAAVGFKPLKSKSSSSDSDLFPERVYGGDALALSARFPGDIYSNLKPLLGLSKKDHPVVAEYESRHPRLHVLEDKSLGTVGFTTEILGGKEDSFKVEELLAMELQNIKGNAEAFAGKGSTIRDVVITVPAFYTAEEKRAIEAAADLAGLRILALITDGLSVGLNYATSRTFPVPSEGAKPEYHLVYDMGAGSTTATILRFQGKTVKDVGKFNKTIQEVQVMGVGWDKTLGGDAFNAAILDDMIGKFVTTNQMKSLGAGVELVKQNGRTIAKLWKEAERMRQVLSANSETSSSFEGLHHEDVNFKYKLTRSEFEELTAVYLERTRTPISQALGMAKLELADLESIILHGGAVRTPFVQKQLEAVTGSAEKIRTNVNSDEAAVFGAAFKAAGISPSFRVKEIKASDIAVHAVSLSWPSDGKERQQKLFLPTSQVGAEKQIPFKSNTEDFSFSLHQQILEGSSSARDVPVIQVQTKNLTASVKDLTDKFGCSVSNISTKFAMRLSPTDGLPEVIRGSVSCETTDLEKKGGVVDDVKGFFGFGSKKGDQAPLSDDDDADLTSSETDVKSSSTLSPLESKTSEPKTSAAKSDEKAKDVKRKTETIFVEFTTTPIGLPQISSAEMRRIKDRMASFDSSDRSRKLREEALNTLEAFTYKARDLLEDDGFVAASTETERATIEEKFRSTSEWLYGDGAEANRETLKLRLKELRDLVDPIQKRKDEAIKRPQEVKLLQQVLEQTRTLVGVMREQVEKASIAAAEASSSSESSSSESLSQATTTSSVVDDFADLDDEPTTTSAPPASTKIPETPVYSEKDLDDLTNAYTTIESWFDEKLAEQKKLSPTDDPVLLSSEMAAKSKDLNKVIVGLLSRKMKVPPKPKSSNKPKTSKTKPAKKSKSTKSSTTVSDTNSTTASDAGSAATEVPEVPEEPTGKGQVKDEL
ncbi:MAG: hypothetical protein Q9187_007854 [Circinaria calcarea]